MDFTLRGPFEDDRFAPYGSLMIWLLGGHEGKLQQLTERLDKAAARHGMEIFNNFLKSKILVNSTNPRLPPA